MPKPARVPGMSGRSYRRPLCSVDPQHEVQRDVSGKWVCKTCFTDFARTFLQDKADLAHKSEGGLDLPSGVKDERVKIEMPVNPIPNRATRRRMRGK